MSRTFRSIGRSEHVHEFEFNARKGREVCISCPKHLPRVKRSDLRTQRSAVRVQITDMTVPALRATCKTRGLDAPARMRKADLVRLLTLSE